MKAVIINTFSNSGSTGKLTHLLATYLKDNGHFPFVISGYGKEEDCCIGHITIQNSFGKLIDGILERITGLHCCFSWFSTRRAIKEIKKIRPDVIYCGNLHGHFINMYSIFNFAKKEHIPIVQMMWDEYCLAGKCTFSFDCLKFRGLCHHCPHLHKYPSSLFFDTSNFLQKKKKKAFDYDLLRFVGVPYTIERAKQSLLLKDKALIALDEAVDLQNRYYPRDADSLREKLGINPNNLIILNVCVYPDVRKGGAYFLELARKCLDLPNVTFVHVGFNGNAEECPSNFIPVGFIKNQDEMPLYYSLADLFVCTSQAETQPNACLEALGCGTPICGFNISGIPTCAEEPFGFFVEFPNVNKLRELVVNLKKKTPDVIYSVRKYAQSRFDNRDYNRKLLEIAQQLANQNKNEN